MFKTGNSLSPKGEEGGTSAELKHLCQDFYVERQTSDQSPEVVTYSTYVTTDDLSTSQLSIIVLFHFSETLEFIAASILF